MSHLAFQNASIPMRSVGPVHVISQDFDDRIMVPLASYEKPIWPSVHRGARVTALSNGISVTLIDERMTRSILLEATSASAALMAWNHMRHREQEMNNMIAKTSRFVELMKMNVQIVGNLLYLRLEYKTGEAAGHNMVTLASEKLQAWIQAHYSDLKYCSISANYCCDKKVSAVNGILGRGKNMIAEATISRDICRRYLRTTPEAIHELNSKKNLLGSIVAGGIRSANAHFANILLAFYLATGQDAANIVEGSQGFTYTNIRNQALYFSVTLPHLILGTVGNGKEIDFVKHNLDQLGCRQKQKNAKNSHRLASICAATVLCGELSLMAAQTNEGELMRSHVRLERS